MSAKPSDAVEPSPSSCQPMNDQMEHIKEWRRLVRTRNRIIATWLGALALNLPVPFVLMALFPSLKNLALGMMGTIMVCWLIACIGGIIIQGSLEKYFAQTMQRNDLSGLSCWIDTLFSPVAKGAYRQLVDKNYEIARAGLLAQLPNITEDAAHFLQPSERLMLYKTLRQNDTELIRTVLQVVPALCETRALSYVQYLADGNGMTATNPELLAQARCTLETLQSRLEMSQGARGLLRASHSPQTPASELLLPAQASNQSNTSELLRASKPVAPRYAPDVRAETGEAKLEIKT